MKNFLLFKWYHLLGLITSEVHQTDIGYLWGKHENESVNVICIYILNYKMVWWTMKCLYYLF